MMTILFAILGLIITFICVVAVHEFGHFIAARMVGVKSEIFSIGFGKPLLRKTDRTGMVWQVAALPIGGYCRFVGDENAASLSSAPDGPPLPGSLRSASLVAQAWVAFAGPLANFILALLLFIGAASLSTTVSYPWTVSDVTPSANKVGFEPGDEIISVGEVQISSQTRWDDALAASDPSGVSSYVIQREGRLERVNGPRLDAAILDLVAPDMPGFEAGLRSGDRIKSVDGHPVNSWSDLQKAVATSEGRSLSVSLERDEASFQKLVTPRLHDGRWLIGLNSQPLLQIDERRLTLLEAIASGTQKTGQVLTYTATGLTATLLGSGDLCELNGPITITRVAGQAIQLGPEIFLTFMAVISLGLGLLNLLPIPILDGGHILSLAAEGVSGRPLGHVAKAVLFIAGVTGVAWLSIMALISDLTC